MKKSFIESLPGGKISSGGLGLVSLHFHSPPSRSNEPLRISWGQFYKTSIKAQFDDMTFQYVFTTRCFNFVARCHSNDTRHSMGRQSVT